MRDPEMILASLFTFFVALAAALLFSSTLRRFKIPWAIALIFTGVIIGPYGLDWFELDDTVLFLSEIGVIFLMFLAGMETRISAIRPVLRDASIVATVSGIVPALVGVAIGLGFGYGWDTALILAIIFMSSSFAVVIPTLEARGLLQTRLSRVIVASTMLQDIASLILFAVLLQFITPESWVPIPALISAGVMAAAGGYLLRHYFSHLQAWFQHLRQKESHEFELFEQELTLTVVILVGAAIVFEILRMETIVGAFFAGILIAEITRSQILEHKVHILGYGIFIPIFFVSVGAWVELSIFQDELWLILPLTAAIVLGSALTKFISGWAAAKVLGYSGLQSSLIGVTSIPQLITTLAVLLVAQNLELLPPEVVTAVVILSVVTVVASPLITNRLLQADDSRL